jgi:FkbM family methyltransferase
MLKDRLKSLLVGTPLSRPARRFSAWLRPPRWPTERLMAHEERCIERLLPLILQPDHNGVDVGSHLGLFLGEFCRLAPRGRHHAFEPIPHKAHWLRRRFPTVEVHEVALGEQPGTASFAYIPNRSGYSGLRFRGEADRDQVVTLEVQVARLDDLLPAEHVVRFIKVDVEGGELGVFRGARRILRQSRPFVLFECYEPAFRHYETTADHVYEALHDDGGLDIYLLADWLDRRPPLDRDGFRAATVPGPDGAPAGFNFLAAPGPRPGDG